MNRIYNFFKQSIIKHYIYCILILAVFLYNLYLILTKFEIELLFYIKLIIIFNNFLLTYQNYLKIYSLVLENLYKYKILSVFMDIVSFGLIGLESHSS